MNDDDPKRLLARNLYWQGDRISEIAKRLDVPYGTVDTWKRRDGWDEASSVIRIDTNIEQRLLIIIAKEDKTERDFKEMDHLSRILERTARIRKFGETGREADINPKIDARNKARKKKQDEKKNALSEEDIEKLVDAFNDGLFEYQKKWNRARRRNRVRNILKSRQIGATWYFAREAIIDAVTTGDNQIFLSASKAQAHVFRDYIVQFVEDVTGVKLKGDPIKLPNGATLYFLGTNAKTAQSYHGHVYLDEYAWIGKFAEFRKVASAMATHKKWRITYFSTPSTINHEAHAFWSGDAFNKGRRKENRVEFDVSHDALKNGAKCPDGQWRQIVTIHDAVAGGCDLFDVDQLRLEYNDQDFANLFLCEWVDDSCAFFTFDELRRCMVDSWDVWDDFDPHAARPFGDRPVWIGYDPARSRDNASISVIAPPAVEGGKFRVLMRLSFVDTDFTAQSEAIRDLTRRFNVEHIGIDTSTIGAGVFEMVRAFFPAATPITYNVEVKGRMVLKAKQIISKGRLEFDGGWTDIPLAFMSIKRTMTPSGRQATFQAERNQETGHADVAWSIMHALDRVNFLDFDQSTNGGSDRRGFVEIF